MAQQLAHGHLGHPRVAEGHPECIRDALQHHVVEAGPAGLDERQHRGGGQHLGVARDAEAMLGRHELAEGVGDAVAALPDQVAVLGDGDSDGERPLPEQAIGDQRAEALAVEARPPGGTGRRYDRLVGWHGVVALDPARSGHCRGVRQGGDGVEAAHHDRRRGRGSTGSGRCRQHHGAEHRERGQGGQTTMHDPFMVAQGLSRTVDRLRWRAWLT